MRLEFLKSLHHSLDTILEIRLQYFSNHAKVAGKIEGPFAFSLIEFRFYQNLFFWGGGEARGEANGEKTWKEIFLSLNQ